MVAALHPTPEVVRTEIRGGAAKLWRGNVEGEIIISGPAGTGKTRAILEWVHHRCANERLRVLILRKTLESLKESALVTYQEQVLHGFDGRRSALDGVSYFGGNTIRPARFTYEVTGSVIVLGGLDNPGKIKSTEYDIIYVNEASELTLDQWESLTSRSDRPTLDATRKPAVVVGDTNPDAPTHWIKAREADGSTALWPSEHKDNPAMWDRVAGQWTASGKRYMARLDKLTGVRYQRLRLGKWVSAEGQVYEAWSDATHLVDREAVADRLASAWHIGAADWGWTKPGVLQVWAIDGDERMVEVAEHFHTRRSVPGWWAPEAKRLTERYGVRVWLCDPSEPEYIAQFRAAGLNAVGATNDILPGINEIEDRLVVQDDGLPRLQIVKDALIERDEELVQAGEPWSTVQEIPRYVWPKSSSGAVVKDRPVDAYNHGLDSARYAAMYLAKPKPAVYVL